MIESLRYIQKQIQKAQSNAKGARVQAEAERFRSSQYQAEGRESDSDLHAQEAAAFEVRAIEHENEIKQLEVKKAELEARITELKAQREAINQDTLEKITAIDKELAALQENLTV